ncbi:MAG TPA: exopolysaccharide transport family protein [Rhodopseudomonas sp.]|uniref:exopolysaccharide transport family protein n=1 Tax=Rhodopseudomonas sp. TaxID=1078 RepID=UPI002ED934C5
MLAYDQPIAAPPLTKSRPARPAGFTVAELVEALWRRKAAIAMAALIGGCVAVMIGKSLTPRYVATAQLYVDPRELQLVDRELTPRAQDVSGLAMVVESQARLITSNNVLLPVIEQLRLEQDPEFGGASDGLFGALLGLAGFGGKAAVDANAVKMSVLENLNRHIAVKRADRTFIVDIDVWSRDPAKAALLANAVSAAYLAESRQSQAAAARRATTDLSGRLTELQTRLRSAENALAVYKAQNNFVGTQDTLVSDQQLSASTQRLAAARAQTLDAQARYDQMESSRRAASDAGAIPEALQSPTIASLRSQYAETRRRYAELLGELGPRHPALKNMEKQVDDLRRTLTEEVNRFAQSAKNDLTRARDYEASLTKALEEQKRQSVDLSQASVRLRELERDVDASRNIYQSFLKRSRETEEQESLNTSSARIIGEASPPQRRIFPPAMSMLAMLGLALGGLAAAAGTLVLEQLRRPQPVPPPPPPGAPDTSPPSAPNPVGGPQPGAKLAPVLLEKPLIARLQPTDVLMTLNGILSGADTADVTRIGWPTLRPGIPITPFLDAMRQIRTAAVRRSGGAAPVMAVVGPDSGEDRAIATLNIALAAARDGAKVLLIDADPALHALSDKFAAAGPGLTETAPPLVTVNGISVLTLPKAPDAKLNAKLSTKARAGAIRTAIAQARAAQSYDLVILDGPTLPGHDWHRELLAPNDNILVVLPGSLDINRCMDDVIAALQGAERDIIGVVIYELPSSSDNYQPARQSA